MSKRGNRGICSFQGSWLTDPESPYLTWLSESAIHGRSYARCRLCQKDFSIESMGVGAVNSHALSKKHKALIEAQKRTHSLRVLFAQSSSSGTEAPPQVSAALTEQFSVLPDAKVSEVATVQQNASARPNFIVPASISKAEIYWCIWSVMSHTHSRAAASACEMFTVMFPECDTANNMSLGRDKIGYSITFGMAPYFSRELRKILSTLSSFVVLFDESMNKIAQRGQMDLHIRFCDNNVIQTRYLTSIFLGRATAEDLLKAFLEGLEGLDLHKILQISMDGPNVNLKFLSEFISTTRSSTTPYLLDCGSCSLHIVCGSLKNADEKTNGFKVGRFLNACYYVFRDLPSRKGLFLSYNGLDNSDLGFPLKFCATRWVENARVVERILPLIEGLKTFVAGVVRDKKKPSSNSFEIMQAALADVLLRAKLAFFQNIAEILEKYLRSYQSDAPMMPFMYGDVLKLLRELCKIVVREEKVNDTTSAGDLCKVDLKETGSHLKPAEKIKLGYAVTAEISSVRSQLTTANLVLFRKQCRAFVVVVLEKLIAKCPLKYPMVKGASCLDPSIMTRESLRKSRVKCALNEFISCKWLSGRQADLIEKEYLEFCQKSSIIKKCKEYKRTERLDSLLFSLLIENEASEDFLTFATRILSLSHGQASVERGFNINKELLVVNQKERSLIAQRVVYDAVQTSVGPNWKQFEITRQLIDSVRSSRRRLQDARDNDNRKKKAQDEAESQRQVAAVLLKAKEIEMKRKQAAHEDEMANISQEMNVLKQNAQKKPKL